MNARGSFRFILIPLGVTFVASCDSAEVKQCRAQYLATHAMVQSTDSNSLDSVDATLKAVEETTALCEKAQLHEELDQLRGVLRKLESTSNYLHQYGSRKELSEDELAALVKSGDPGCPKGQAYQYRKTQKQIRCVGPQVVTMNWEQVKSYFGGRGFKLSDEGATLRAEYGSESYVFHYSKPTDSAPASCVEVFAAPGIPWEESVARVTGARVHTLKEGKPVRAPGGTLPLSHVKDETQAIYKLGQCE